MRKVISYSLYGDNPKYCMGLLLNAPLKNEYFPDWEMVCYYNETVPYYFIDEATRLGIKMIKTDSTAPGTFWRFFIADTDADIFIIRDADDRLNHFHKKVVDEFINSDCLLHIVKGHKGHYNSLIMGGLWGAKKGLITNMQERIRAYPHRNIKESDLTFLNSIYEQYKDVALTHGIRSFPSKKFIQINELKNELGGVHEWWMVTSKLYKPEGITFKYEY
jgi:hypothetical protein